MWVPLLPLRNRDCRNLYVWMFQQRNYSQSFPVIRVHFSSILWIVLLLYCLFQVYHQRTQPLRTEDHSWRSGQKFPKNNSHLLQYPIDFTDLQLWSMDHLEILLWMFYPFPALRPLTPQNIVRPLFFGYFDYPGLQKLWSPQGHPASHLFIPPQNFYNHCHH